MIKKDQRQVLQLDKFFANPKCKIKCQNNHFSNVWMKNKCRWLIKLLRIKIRQQKRKSLIN
jgi:hypothetical protein